MINTKKPSGKVRTGHLSSTEGLNDADDSDVPVDDQMHYVPGGAYDSYVDAAVLSISDNYANDDFEFTRANEDEELDASSTLAISEELGMDAASIQRAVRFETIWKSPTASRDDVIDYLRAQQLISDN